MISIIIPIYNVENYLRNCLESIQNQKFQDFEVIMVDDGSKDASAIIAKEYEKRNPTKYRYFFQTNKGQGAARNSGITHAKGDYLAFIDADDYIHDDFLKVLYDNLLKYDADISICGVYRFWDNGALSSNLITNDGERVVDDIHSYLQFGSFSVWNKIYKRALFEGLSFPENMKFEDFALMPRIIERSKRLISTERKLYYYRWNPTSTTNSVSIQPDILKAQYILENDAFSERNPDLITIFFVRQVMGTYLWSLQLTGEGIIETKSIVYDALQKYPNIKNYMNDKYIGQYKSMWGELLLNKHFALASIYCRTYEYLRNIVRKIKNI